MRLKEFVRNELEKYLRRSGLDPAYIWIATHPYLDNYHHVYFADALCDPMYGCVKCSVDYLLNNEAPELSSKFDIIFPKTELYLELLKAVGSSDSAFEAEGESEKRIIDVAHEYVRCVKGCEHSADYGKVDECVYSCISRALDGARQLIDELVHNIAYEMVSEGRSSIANKVFKVIDESKEILSLVKLLEKLAEGATVFTRVDPSALSHILVKASGLTVDSKEAMKRLIENGVVAVFALPRRYAGTTVYTDFAYLILPAAVKHATTIAKQR